MRKHFAWLAAAAAAAVVAASPASAASVFCQTGTPVTGTVNGTVFVGPGVSCLIARAHVTGSVLVSPGGSLLMIGSTVDRNVLSNGATFLVIAGFDTILGDLKITGTSGVPPAQTANAVCTTTVAGALALASNPAPFVVGCGRGLGNTAGSAIVSSNSGGVLFQFNTITGTEICTGPPPVVGGGNRAAKNIGCP
jgi:hypothetical protein